ncbi:iron complex transport system substrate-binding protein [Thiohalophilus thiocyanatoxydans]|uniref:Iron complex transport system substrate-binding protein n=2 Tax=Thiohalophilus thiocyanatoxydans TaxID=381308 RepID=A0A4R8IK59_9GAMM|nr:iron complex transport system substrate-binding protein [Thiohalophilus thiocyanatoxydans]
MATRQKPVIRMSRLLHYSLLAGLLFLSLPANASADCPRIISQSPYITHTLEWLGLKQCIVGASRYDQLEVPDTGGVMDPDGEIIASLEPAILFTSDWTDPQEQAAITPENARSYRLQGFQSMAQIEQNLRTIIEATGRTDLEPRTEQFARQWREAANRLEAAGTRALLLSSCSGKPYSFGRETWLYDLFTTAGFEVVETHRRIRHLQPGKEIEDLTALLNRFEPEVLFIFERHIAKNCNMLTPEVPVRIVTLDGELFLHPAPVLLKGIARLQSRQNEWK